MRADVGYLAVGLAALLSACTTEVLFRLGPVPACEADGDAGVSSELDAAGHPPSLLWAITEGECSPLPGVVVAQGLGDQPISVDAVVPSGPQCFWSISLDEQQCRIVAVASETRRLPREREPIELNLSCVPDRDLIIWDRVVERIAGCAPGCSPSRCECADHPSCEIDDAVLGGASCPPPLRGNLMSLSSTHACAGIFGGTRLQCWGDRRGFSEGDGLVSSPDDIDIAENLAPLRETVDPSSLGLSAFDTGGQMTCVVNLDGRVSCFGASAPEAGTVFVHDVDNDALDARELAVGDGFACVVARVDPPQVFCWGENGSSQTGRPGPNAGRAFPVAVPGGGTPQDVAAGRAHACSLAGGEIYCWGDNSNGQVSASAGAGPAPPTRVTVPTDGAVLPVMPWVAVDAGGDRTCAIDTASRLWCWGGPRGTPAGCLGCSFDIGFRDVSVGETHLCGRNTRGDTVCLGLGPGDRPSPLDGVARAIAGNGVTCGTRTGDSQAAIVCETATDAVGVVDSALLEALLGRGHTTEGRDVVCP